MGEHTPGPWTWRSDYRLYGGDVPIAELYRDSADARLIAAAPDDPGFGEPSSELVEARAAIAKATTSETVAP